ncbi:MAG TPA: endonuclease V [Methylomirabilota bacterium]|nr:endonuclease V [Methylomirabilota bacterium]
MKLLAAGLAVLTVAEARDVQQRLRRRLRLSGGPRRVRIVAGVDLAYRADGSRAWAAVVLVSVPDGRVLEVATATGRPRFPYVPGFLSFREGPLVLRAFRRLRRRPDLVVFDGQGIAHPRGFGLASHLGVLLGLPSVGCAKSRLVGEHAEPGPRRGDWAPLRIEGRVRGAVLRTREGVKPVYVSQGHRIGLNQAIASVLALTRFRVPEPIRLAEQTVNVLKRAHAGLGGSGRHVQPLRAPARPAPPAARRGAR